MEAQNINSNTYFQTVGTSSVSVTLVPSDLAIVSPAAANFYAIIVNTGTAPVFAVCGAGSAPTAVYPTSATVPVPGKIIAAGSTQSFKMLPGTTHISFIATGAGNGVGLSVGQGL